MSLADRVLARDRRAVARMIRAIDDRSPGHDEELRRLHRHAGRAALVGVTGSPGAGKSTLTDGLIRAYRGQGKTVAVLAVDPSSPFTGGAILGDRIRMGRHTLDEGVFIRSLATRGHLGGLSRSAIDAAVVLDAAGFDIVLLETVGVGQDEVDVARWADTTVVVTVPEAGDQVQTLKAGVMEVADVFAVNKSDRPGAEAAMQHIEAMLRLPGGRERTWTPPVLRTVGTTGEGVEGLVEAIAAHRAHLAGSAEGAERLAARSLESVLAVFKERVVDIVRTRGRAALEAAAERVRRGESDPITEAEALMALVAGAGPVADGSQHSIIRSRADGEGRS